MCVDNLWTKLLYCTWLSPFIACYLHWEIVPVWGTIIAIIYLLLWYSQMKALFPAHRVTVSRNLGGTVPSAGKTSTWPHNSPVRDRIFGSFQGLQMRKNGWRDFNAFFYRKRKSGNEWIMSTWISLQAEIRRYLSSEKSTQLRLLFFYNSLWESESGHNEIINLMQSTLQTWA